MANPKPNTAGLKPFGAGPDPRRNAGGKPVGARNALQGDFMRALAEDFAEHGAQAIVETRQNSPAQYLKIVASLMPKELEIKRPLEDISDDELAAAYSTLQSLVNGAGAGDARAEGSEQAQGLSGLH
jgi:hypothetical protein